MEILHSATTFVRRSKVAESWAVENRWMWQGIERMRESENSASSVNLAIKSHRSQLLWKSQWNYSRERQLLLHYQLLPLPPLHLYISTCHTYSTATSLGASWSKVVRSFGCQFPLFTKKAQQTNCCFAQKKKRELAQRMCQAWLNNCIRPKVEGYFSRF